MGRLHVIGAPPELTVHLETWFASGGLALPGDLTWTVEVHPDPWFDAPGSTAVRQGEVAIEPRADGTLRIAHPEGIDVVVEAQAPHARWVIAEELVAHVDEWLPTVGMLALVFGLRRMGWHHVHAASAVSPDGTGWLFVGPSGTGKSTTITALGAAGWRVGGDDAVFLVEMPDRIEASPWAGTIGLRAGGRALLDAAMVKGTQRVGGRASIDRGKDRQNAAVHGFAPAGRFVPGIVAFTQVGDAVTSVAAAPLPEAMGALIVQSAWVALEPLYADAHLRMLERVLRQARAIHVTLAPDLLDSPPILSQLLPP